MKFCLFILLCLANTASYSKTSITVVTEDLWPFNYVENNEVKGPHTDIVKALLKRSNMDYTIAVLPWARAYKLVSTHPNTLIYTINHTKERHEKFHWIGELSSTANINFYALKSAGYTTLSQLQLQGLRVGTQIDTANDAYITNHHFKFVSRVSHIRQTVGMLKRGRIDVVIASPKQLARAAKETGLSLDELIKVGHDFSSSPSIAISLTTPKLTVERLQQAFIELTGPANQ